AMTQPFQSRFTTGQIGDTTFPQVLLTNPINGENGVPTNTPISVLFSERIDPATFTTQGVSVLDLTSNQSVAPALMQVDADGVHASFVPSKLGVGRTYAVLLDSDIKDTAGNGLLTSSFVFTTGFTSDAAGLVLTGMSPVDGDAGVPRNAPIVLQFSDAINPIAVPAGLQVTQGGVAVPG